MKKSIAIIFILLSLFGACFAEEESLPILPWSINWDSTMAEYIAIMKEISPDGEYKIALYDPTMCYIEYKDDDIITYDAYFRVDSGVLDTNKMNYQLSDFEHVKAVLVKFETYYRQKVKPQSQNDEMIDKFRDTYTDFSSKYGNCDERYSYIRLNIYQASDFQYYSLPVQSGEVDFSKLKTYILANLDLLNNYSIILSNEHSQCGIKILILSNSMHGDDQTITGYFWTAMTREKNEMIDGDMNKLPQ